MNMTTLRGGVFKGMLGAAVLALASIGAAQAAVITFEGNSGAAYNQDAFRQAGYTVGFFDPAGSAPARTVQVGRFVDGSNPAACGVNVCPINNASTYFDLFNSGFIDILPNVSGATFSFSGLDASFIAGINNVLTPAAVQVLGVLADGSTTAIQFNLPWTTAFQSYTLADAVGGAEFGKLRFTEIAIIGYRCDARGQCSGLDNGNGQIGLDNIRLTDVPEPATASLVALGLLGLGIRARRRA
jgi:hypothetical protein